MLPTPMLDIVLAECKAFDDENRDIESALEQLVQHFPHNTEVPHVLLKTTAINNLYHARVQDKDLLTLATHIVSQNIDPLLAEGSPSVPALIWNSPCARRYYSFASKYCSWHNPDAYPMLDRNVIKALFAYRKLDEFAWFTENNLYETTRLIDVVSAFRVRYGLETLRFKEIDKFLWRVGDCIVRSV